MAANISAKATNERLIFSSRHIPRLFSNVFIGNNRSSRLLGSPKCLLELPSEIKTENSPLVGLSKITSMANII